MLKTLAILTVSFILSQMFEAMPVRDIDIWTEKLFCIKSEKGEKLHRNSKIHFFWSRNQS